MTSPIPRPLRLVLQPASTLLICCGPASSDSVTLTMRTTTPWTVLGLLVIATIAAATAAAEEEPAPTARGTLLHQYFDVKDGAVVLSKQAPLVKEPGTWTATGTFNSRDGLKIEIPLANVDPSAKVVEDQGVTGWISHSFSMKSSSTTIFGPGSGSFSWNLVEGSRASKLVIDCRYNDPYYCQSDKKDVRYVGTFPGHGPDARPHTHGNETHRTDGLEAREFGWVLTYTIPPCSSLSCPVLYGNYQYTFNLVVDGTTFVEYWVDGATPAPEPAAPEAEPVADAPADDNATDNATDNSTDPADPDDGNSTSNNTSGKGSSSGKADSGFGPQSYNVQPKGKAPGLPLAGFVVALIAGLAFSRRRRA